MAPEILTAGLPTLAVLIGILVNNSRLTDLRHHFDSRLNDLKQTMEARFQAVDVRFQAVDTRFQAVDARFDAMDRIFNERLRCVEEILDARLSRIEQELHIK